MVPERPVTHGLAATGPVQAISRPPPPSPRLAGDGKSIRAVTTGRAGLHNKALAAVVRGQHAPGALPRARHVSGWFVRRDLPHHARDPLPELVGYLVSCDPPARGEDLVDPARGERRRRLTQAAA